MNDVGAVESGALTLADWPGEHGPGRVSGSLYAVPPSLRREAARLLANRGHGVHCDVILDAQGADRGVGTGLFSLIREDHPGADLEVHLILPAGRPGPVLVEAVAGVVASAGAARAGLLVLPPTVLGETSCADALAGYRRTGGRIWAEVSPGHETAVPSGVDGALIMLITPGTRDAADPRLLDRIAGLAGRIPVGVDGGVTPALAAKAFAAGAGRAVAGRSLFRAAHISSRKERAQ